MNCTEFLGRLQRQLDDRLPPEADSQLIRHAERCEACRSRLDLWRRLAAVMPTAETDLVATTTLAATSSRSHGFSRWSLAALAASAALLVFVVSRETEPEVSVVAQDRHPPLTVPGPRIGGSEQPRIDGSEESVGDPSGGLAWKPIDAADWWERVHGGAWVDQTLPTVQSMREGVAPLGRTLMRAVTILTIGGYDQTS